MTTKNKYKLLESFDKDKNLEFYICDFISIEDLENLQDFDDLQEFLEDNNAFDIDIIYYSRAIKYLQEHDASLTDSMNIADELGYEPKNINSELLASLLASRNARDDFYNYQNELTEILTK